MDPDASVRRGAVTTGLGPKNLDVNCRDMSARVNGLQSAGYPFHSEISEYHVGDIYAREVKIAGHDQTNIVFEFAACVVNHLRLVRKNMIFRALTFSQAFQLPIRRL